MEASAYQRLMDVISVSTPLPSVLDAVREAQRRADRDALMTCLEVLLETWRATPEPRLGRAIRALGGALEGPVAHDLRALAIKRKNLPQDKFLKAMEEATVADRGAALDLITRGRVAEINERAGVLATWLPDPRITQKYIDKAYEGLDASPKWKPFWQVGFEAILSSPEPETLSALEDMFDGGEPFSTVFVSEKTAKWMNANLRETRDKLASLVESRGETGLDEAALAMLEGMAATGF